MQLGIVSFTAKGAELGYRLYEIFCEEGEDCSLYASPKLLTTEQEKAGARFLEGPIGQWAGQMFSRKQTMIFIGAAGIAVRAIAPFVKDKFSDPPVLVIDEGGQFVIPILSGHVGGANELARRIAGWIGAVPVITTATDVNGLFAVDVFAAKNNLFIAERSLAKAVSASLLSGERIGFFDDFLGQASWQGLPEKGLPKGFAREVCAANVWITLSDKRSPFEISGDHTFLRLLPKAVVLGIGCRRGVSPQALMEAADAFLKAHHLSPETVKAAATIDLKKDEEAVLSLCRKKNWPLRIYSAGQLAAVCGRFSESEFVKQQTGVGNVCERSACAGGGRLLVQKEAGNKITLAAALEL